MVQVPVSHRPRRAGTSKYGLLNRIFRASLILWRCDGRRRRPTGGAPWAELHDLIGRIPTGWLPSACWGSPLLGTSWCRVASERRRERGAHRLGGCRWPGAALLATPCTGAIHCSSWDNCQGSSSTRATWCSSGSWGRRRGGVIAPPRRDGEPFFCTVRPSPRIRPFSDRWSVGDGVLVAQRLGHLLGASASWRGRDGKAPRLRWRSQGGEGCRAAGCAWGVLGACSVPTVRGEIITSSPERFSEPVHGVQAAGLDPGGLVWPSDSSTGTLRPPRRPGSRTPSDRVIGAVPLACNPPRHRARPRCPRSLTRCTCR